MTAIATNPRTGYVFGQKRNFRSGQRVTIHDFAPDVVYTGTIRGISVDYVVDHYIVELSSESLATIRVHKPDYDWTCISVTEACLRAD
jgi:hypothetical protein